MSNPFRTAGSGPGVARWLTLLLVLLLSAAGVKAADDAIVGVLYPEVRPPYDRIFAEITQGIVAGVSSRGGRVKTYVLPAGVDPKMIASELERDGVRTLIVLGNRGLELIHALPKGRRVIIGAVNATPDTNGKVTAGISLSPDPKVLFKYLTRIDPKVKRVFVVYNPGKYGWLIDRARKAARRYRLKLEATPATNLQEAAKEYRSIVDRAGGSDAIWVLPDRSVFDTQAILPLLLEKAWDRRFAVFSANPGQVSKGALFALYPDNEGMGRRLAELALDTQGHGRKAGVELLRDVMTAVNTRTARRLGLRFSGGQRREFDLVFPTP